MITLEQLSPTILGTMQFMWTTTREESSRLLDAYIDLGGNAIDTADVYTNWAERLKGGEAETIIGSWLNMNPSKRDEICLITKVGSRMWAGPDGEGLSKAHVTRALNDSLRRLQTDHIDVYLMHFPDAQTSLEETLSTMSDFVKQGKIRHIGFSNYSPSQTSELLVASQHLTVPVEVVQAYYNLVDRQTYEQEYRSLFQDHSLTVLSYGSLASGFLTGVYRPELPMPTHARAAFAAEKMTEKNLRLLSELDRLSGKYHKSIAQIALAWLVGQPTITSAIIGADTVEQLRSNFISSSEWLERADIQRLDLVAEGEGGT